MALAALGLSGNPVHEPVHVWLANAWRAGQLAKAIHVLQAREIAG